MNSFTLGSTSATFGEDIDQMTGGVRGTNISSVMIPTPPPRAPANTRKNETATALAPLAASLAERLASAVQLCIAKRSGSGRLRTRDACCASYKNLCCMACKRCLFLAILRGHFSCGMGITKGASLRGCRTCDARLCISVLVELGKTARQIAESSNPRHICIS